MDPHAVFHLALAQVMQLRLPLPVVLQVFGNALGEKNVPRSRTSLTGPL